MSWRYVREQVAPKNKQFTSSEHIISPKHTTKMFYDTHLQSWSVNSNMTLQFKAWKSSKKQCTFITYKPEMIFAAGRSHRLPVRNMRARKRLCAHKRQRVHQQLLKRRRVSTLHHCSCTTGQIVKSPKQTYSQTFPMMPRVKIHGTKPQICPSQRSNIVYLASTRMFIYKLAVRV